MPTFYEQTRDACANPVPGRNIASAVDRQRQARVAMCEELVDLDQYRDRAAQVRDYALNNLDRLLEQFTSIAEQNGVHVHWAENAAQACEIIAEVAAENKVRSVVKSKSMITEEIGLTEHFENKGIDAIETDLGEFIIQIARQKPAHIVLPAIHLNTGEVADIFREHLGYTGSADPQELTRAARIYLREKFRRADMGISGVNLAVAQNGSWFTCTNEGNGRFVMNLPRVYLGVMGLERIVANMEHAALILKLLARFATGQRLTQYVNIMSRLRADRSQRIHLVLLDNGRSKILAGKYHQMLRCIRCGACLNICPVFRFVGGQSFPGCYSGPMGTVLLPLLNADSDIRAVPKGCSLCSICGDTCPVKIPLTDYVLELRNDLIRAEKIPTLEKIGMTAGAKIMAHPRLYRWAQRLGRFGLKPLARDNWIHWLPSVPGRWTKVKDFPMLARKFFLHQPPEDRQDR